MRPQHDYAAINNIKRLKPQKKMPDGSFGSLKRGTFSVLNNAESFPIWKTTLGPIAVLRDNPENNNAKSHLAAKFSEHANGVIRMWTKDGKKYTGHWARKCRGIQHLISGGVRPIIQTTLEITKLVGAQRRPVLIREMAGLPNTRH